MSPQPELLEELIEEVFLRLPPEEPKHLVRASSVCKPWRRLLADRGFRRRYRKFHGKPPMLGFIVGVYRFLFGNSRFVPTSSFIPAQTDHPLGWDAFDARHGWALSFTTNTFSSQFDTGDFGLVVWDPTTDEQNRLPPSFFSVEDYKYFTAAVLCAVEGCDHCCCQGGPFHVVAVSTKNGIVSARRYSSETGAWSEPTSVHHWDARAISMTSILVGDALYFAAMPNHVIKCELLGSLALRLSVFEAPQPLAPYMDMGTLVTTEDGGLGFASVHDTSLIMWSRETGSDEGWAQQSVINLKMMLPDDALLSPTLSHSPLVARVCGFAEGTQVIFVGTFGYVGDSVYMVELKSRQVQKLVDVNDCARVYPYMSFYIPGITYVLITMYDPLLQYVCVALNNMKNTQWKQFLPARGNK